MKWQKDLFSQFLHKFTGILFNLKYLYSEKKSHLIYLYLLLANLILFDMAPPKPNYVFFKPYWK